jgi:hypothetical protein
MVQPARIRLQTVPAAGTFQELWTGFGASLIAADEGAIVNGLGLDEPVMKGQWIKLVDRVKRP